MKVLVSDNLGEVGIQMFEDEDGLSVDVKTGLSPEELEHPPLEQRQIPAIVH